MADFLLAFSTDANGQPSADRVLTPAGDWATVAGTALVAQNILLFLFTPIGQHPTDPLFGTSLWADIGQPEQDDSVYALALAEAAAYFQALQATTTTPLNEQISGIDNVVLAPTDPNALGVLHLSFAVHTASGESLTVTT